MSKESSMPVIRVELFAGRTREQKRAFTMR
jgi:phenylpyruvate tautomerase PptA (4-oxalocrotonate tautomerase family)